VVAQPLVAWLWLGGVLIVVGSVLSAIPGRRRRPTDPVSAPVVAVAGQGPTDLNHEGDGDLVPVGGSEGGGDRLPVGAGESS
jgi:hypothetical protein